MVFVVLLRVVMIVVILIDIINLFKEFHFDWGPGYLINGSLLAAHRYIEKLLVVILQKLFPIGT